MITIVKLKKDADKIEQNKSKVLKKTKSKYHFVLITAKVKLDKTYCVFETTLN